MVRKKGDIFTVEEASARKTAIDAFVKSTPGYRMTGTLEYMYYSGGTSSNLRTKVDMFRNSETGVSRFAIESLGGDEKLNRQFRIADGTYYLLTENGKEYVLREQDGKREILVSGEAKTVRNVLSGYYMENILSTGLMGRRDAQRYHLWEADYYRADYEETNTMVLGNLWSMLRTYSDKPVKYIHRFVNNDTGIGYIFSLDFYYDDVPADVPVAEEWK